MRFLFQREIKGIQFDKGYRDEPPRDEKKLAEIIANILEMMKEKTPFRMLGEPRDRLSGTL